MIYVLLLIWCCRDSFQASCIESCDIHAQAFLDQNLVSYASSAGWGLSFYIDDTDGCMQVLCRKRVVRRSAF